MAKLSVTVAVLAILYLVVVDASIYRTTTTITEIDEEIPSTSQRSQPEKRKRQDLSHCEQFITQSKSENPLRCCNQLGHIAEIQWQCEALKEIVRKGEEHGQEMQELRKRAGTIVTYCRMGTPQHCLRDSVSSILREM